MAINKLIRNLFQSEDVNDPNAKTILIVDDDDGMRDNLKDVLEAEGYVTYQASAKYEAVELAEKVIPKLALVDLKLPDGSGVALMADIKNFAPDCLCILITAFADVDSAIQALEKGAFYYLRKPVKPAELIELVEVAFETIAAKREKTEEENALRERNKELEEIVARLKKASQ